jgi:pyroglutamyl-peptidase
VVRLRVWGCLVLVVLLLGPGLAGGYVSGSSGRVRVVLVTGFESFGNYSVNPSGEVAEALDGMWVDGDVVIVGFVLPVNFSAAVAMVDAAIDELQPVVVVSTGLNARLSGCVAVEHWGVNLMREPRGGGGWVLPRRLDPRGPWVRPVSIPVGVCVNDLREGGIPVRASWWAGVYVCNAVLYGELGHVQACGLNVSVGFVHVPLLDSQDPDGLPLSVLVDAVVHVVGCSLPSCS